MWNVKGCGVQMVVECRGLEAAQEGTTKVMLEHGCIFEFACGVPRAGGCAGRDNEG